VSVLGYFGLAICVLNDSLLNESSLSLILVCIVLNNFYFRSFSLLKFLFSLFYLNLKILILIKRMVIIFVFVLVLVMKIALPVSSPTKGLSCLLWYQGTLL